MICAFFFQRCRDIGRETRSIPMLSDEQRENLARLQHLDGFNDLPSKILVNILAILCSKILCSGHCLATCDF